LWPWNDVLLGVAACTYSQTHMIWLPVINASIEAFSCVSYVEIETNCDDIPPAPMRLTQPWLMTGTAFCFSCRRHCLCARNFRDVWRCYDVISV
jgi:hypothetical protein